MRWSASGRGKSGGARIISHWHCEACPAYLIMLYLESERTDLLPSEIARIKTACKELANAHRSSD